MSIGCWINIDQSTVSQAVWKVIRAIINSYPNVFHHDIQNGKEQFFNKFGMPNILGSIDWYACSYLCATTNALST